MDTPTKDRLYEALTIRNMKAIDLSRTTGLSRGAISQWLSGKANPKQDKIYIMSKALNVSAAWLMGKDVPMDEPPYHPIPSNHTTTNTAPPESQNPYYLDPEVAELADRMKNQPGMRILFDAAKDVSKEDLETVAKMMEALKKTKK